MPVIEFYRQGSPIKQTRRTDFSPPRCWQSHCELNNPGFYSSIHQFVLLTPTETENPVSDTEAEAVNSSSGSE
jgi:hypothetical protein